MASSDKIQEFKSGLSESLKAQELLTVFLLIGLDWILLGLLYSTIENRAYRKGQNRSTRLGIQEAIQPRDHNNNNETETTSSRATS